MVGTIWTLKKEFKNLITIQVAKYTNWLF
jgi:hypothetical protein